MAVFQKTVVTIAITILIISLCLIGITLYRQKYTSNYPPVIANCPDYWDVSGNFCKNSMDLGNSKCNANMDFTTAQWSGNSGLQKKYDWAKACNLTWDGITNNTDLTGV
jgi:hypothetical protein